MAYGDQSATIFENNGLRGAAREISETQQRVIARHDTHRLPGQDIAVKSSGRGALRVNTALTNDVIAAAILTVERNMEQ